MLPHRGDSKEVGQKTLPNSSVSQLPEQLVLISFYLLLLKIGNHRQYKIKIQKLKIKIKPLKALRTLKLKTIWNHGFHGLFGVSTGKWKMR
jgi:hypothetical protein